MCIRDSPFILEELKVNISGLVSGSRIQLYNLSKNTEIANTVVSATAASIDYENGVEFELGDIARLRVTRVDGVTGYLPFEVTGIASSVGISLFVSQELDAIYNENSVDGSALSTWTADFTNTPMGVDLSESDGGASVQELYAYIAYSQTTVNGIDKWFNVVRAIDAVSYTHLRAHET